MQPFDLDDLPAHDDWPARLLGLADSAAEWGGTGVAAYEQTHADLLDVHEANPELDADELARAAKRHAREDPAPISREGDLYLASPDALQDRQNEALLDAVDPVLDGGENVVALGCGFGHELHVLASAYPDCTLVGGEPSAPGRALADRLVGDVATVEDFDFRAETWPLLDRAAEGETVVLTRGSLSALPSSRDAVDTLAGYADSLAAGVHLEYVHELHPTDTLLGLLRRAYTHERGYDEDLRSALRAADSIDVTATDYDVVGGNPLHPQSVVRWEPAAEGG